MDCHMTMTDGHRAAMSDHMTDTKERMTEKQIERFRDHLIREEKSSGTVEKYLRDVRSFFRFLPEKRVTKEQTLAWKEHLICSGYAAATVNSMLASLNSFLRFLGRTECCVRPLRRQRRIFRDRDRELTKEEYDRLLRAAQQAGKRRLYFILQTLAATGIRISELRFITAQSLRTRRAEVDCKGKQRVVLLTEKLCRSLRAYCREEGISSGPVFVTRKGNPVDRSNVWTEMKRLCGAAGVEAKKVFPHNLRHLFARAFYRLNRDIAKLADLLGHSSIDTTRIYIMESDREHEKLVDRLGFVV